MGRRENYAQFLLRVSQNFDAALPFSDELAIIVLPESRCLTRRSLMSVRLGPLNCFDHSAHKASLFHEQRSAEHSALGKDYVSCLSITDRYTPPGSGTKTFALPPRGSVFRETAHVPEQQGKFSSTTLIRSKPRVGFGTTRWPLMRRPSRASFGVISPVTKTIGTSCSAQSASSCVATSRPSACGMIRSTITRSGLKLQAVSNACRGSFTAHAK